MIKVLLAILISLVTTLGCLGENVSPKLIAVYVVGEVNNDYKKVINSSIIKEINKDNTFKVVERAEEILSTVISEVGHQESGVVNQNQMIQLGRQAGVSYIFAVDISDILGELYATTRIINAEDALVLASSDVSKRITDLPSLKTFASEIATRTISELPDNKQKRYEEERRLRKRKEAEQQQKKLIQEAKVFLSKCRLVKVFTNKDVIDEFKSFEKSNYYRFAQKDDVIKYLTCCKLLEENQYDYEILCQLCCFNSTYHKNNKTTSYELSSYVMYVDNGMTSGKIYNRPIYYSYDNYHKKVMSYYNSTLSNTYILLISE